MKEGIRSYRSDTCNRNPMAEAAAKEVREVYGNVWIKEVGEGKKNDALKKKTAGNKSFILIASNDLWRDGQWLRYWEERMKAFSVVMRQDGEVTLDAGADGVSECLRSEKRVRDL